jgi:hypothetical protein
MRSILFTARGDVLGKVISGNVAIGFALQGYNDPLSMASTLLSLGIIGNLALMGLLILGVVAIIDGLLQFNKPSSKFIERNQYLRLLVYPPMSLAVILMAWAYRDLHGNLPFDVIFFATRFSILFLLVSFYDACIANARQAAHLRNLREAENA